MDPDGADPYDEWGRFHCNFPGCMRRTEVAYVTSCSHIFCEQHAKQVFKGRDTCPCCPEQSRRVDVISLDLSRKNVVRKGRMCLVGMNPTEIQQACETAMCFWMTQKSYEHAAAEQRQATKTEKLASTEKSVKIQMSTLEGDTEELKAQQQHIQKSIDETRKASGDIIERKQRLKRELAETEDKYARLAKPHGEPRNYPACIRQQPQQHQRQSPSLIDFGKSRPSFREPAPKERLFAPVSPAPAANEAVRGSSTPWLAPSARRSRSPQSTGAFLNARESGRGVPSFTPGFLGTGRLTKRRLAD